MRVLTSVLALAVLAFSSRGALADAPKVVDDTHFVIQDKAETILKWAYPTAKGLRANIEGTWTNRNGGYNLDERFDYNDSDGDAQSFTLRFTLDDGGKVTDLSELRRSEIWPTFGTGNLILAFMKQGAQNDIDNARRANREPPQFALLVVKATKLEDLVVFVVNAGRLSRIAR